MLLMFIFLGEFTVKASPGMWIDYARTRQISENRYLLHQHYGKKGEYDQGAELSILDDNGERLYTIGDAYNAWYLNNGILGNEDIFLFQNRLDPSWYLWHPDFGTKEIHDSAQYSGESAKSVHVSTGGAIYFVMQNNKETMITEIKFIDKKPKSLFERERPAYRRQTHKIGGEPDIEFGTGKLLLHFPFLPGGGQPSTYYEYRFDSDNSNKFRQYDLGIGFVSMDVEDNWIMLERRGIATILHNGERAVFVMNDQEPESTARQAFLKLNNAMGSGVVEAKGERLRYIYDNVLHELDIAQRSFNRYRLRGKWSANKGLARPGRRIFKVNHQVFQVKEAAEIATKNLERLSSTSIPESFLPDDTLLRIRVREQFDAPDRQQ